MERAVHEPKERTMAEAATYKIVELAGTSTESIAEAMWSGVRRAAKTLRGIDWVETTAIRGHVEDGEIAHFQVEMKVGFRLED
jgi:flavin-binding protein dodecin